MLKCHAIKGNTQLGYNNFNSFTTVYYSCLFQYFLSTYQISTLVFLNFLDTVIFRSMPNNGVPVSSVISSQVGITTVPISSDEPIILRFQHNSVS